MPRTNLDRGGVCVARRLGRGLFAVSVRDSALDGFGNELRHAADAIGDRVRSGRDRRGVGDPCIPRRWGIRPGRRLRGRVCQYE